METKTRIVAIIIKKGRLLLLKGIGYEELWTPGGKIEPGETDENCLRRELAEEIGIKITGLNFFKKYSEKSFYNPNQIIKEKVYITSISGNIKIGAEIEDFVWLSKEDFEKRIFPMIPITEKKIIPDLIKKEIF